MSDGQLLLRIGRPTVSADVSAPSNNPSEADESRDFNQTGFTA